MNTSTQIQTGSCFSPGKTQSPTNSEGHCTEFEAHVSGQVADVGTPFVGPISLEPKETTQPGSHKSRFKIVERGAENFYEKSHRYAQVFRKKLIRFLHIKFKGYNKKLPPKKWGFICKKPSFLFP